MATISDILPIKWPGQEWRIDGDDYKTLEWFGDVPKPTEAAIRAYAGEVDATLAQRAALVAAEERLLQAGPAQFLMFVQTSVAGFTAIYNNLDAATKAKLDADEMWKKVVAAGKQALGQ